MTAADSAGRLRDAVVRVRATARRASAGFFADQAPQSAAAISYYALLSLFPLAILMVTAFSLVADDAVARARVIDLVLTNVPLREEQGRRELEELLVSATAESGGFGVAGALGLLFAAGGVMGPCARRSTARGASKIRGRSPRPRPSTCCSCSSSGRSSPSRSP